MTDDTRQTPDSPPDASDVVEGPVGSASLRDPATSGPMGADLDELPTIEPEDGTPADPQSEGRSTRADAHHERERQDSDHVGVDWDLTSGTRD